MDAAVDALVSASGKVASGLSEFRRTAGVFSSRSEDLLRKYEKRWVAAFAGKVQADAATLKGLLAKVDRLGLPRGAVMVRFIERETQKLILDADRTVR